MTGKAVLITGANSGIDNATVIGLNNVGGFWNTGHVTADGLEHTFGLTPVGGTSFGTLATLWTLMGPLYILGALFFGFATLRAGILSRWAAGLFGFGAVFSLAFVLLPRAVEPLAAGAGGRRSGVARVFALV